MSKKDVGFENLKERDRVRGVGDEGYRSYHL